MMQTMHFQNEKLNNYPMSYYLLYSPFSNLFVSMSQNYNLPLGLWSPRKMVAISFWLYQIAYINCLRCLKRFLFFWKKSWFTFLDSSDLSWSSSMTSTFTFGNVDRNLSYMKSSNLVSFKSSVSKAQSNFERIGVNWETERIKANSKCWKYVEVGFSVRVCFDCPTMFNCWLWRKNKMFRIWSK